MSRHDTVLPADALEDQFQADAAGDHYGCGAARVVPRRCTQIAFVNEVAPMRNLYVMDADGSDVHQVGDDGLYFVPAWQPRGG